MSLSRRKFLALLSAGLVSTKLLAREDMQDALFYGQNKAKEPVIIEKKTDIILPKGLHKGSTIAITSPASPSSMGRVSKGMRYFKKKGLKVIPGYSVRWQKNKHRYFAATDKDRAKEFMSFIENKDVDCIFCARGGYGSMRILPYLDFDIIKANPKIIIGYSDITALLNAIYVQTGIVTFHGPVASSSFDSYTSEYVEKVLFSIEKFKPISMQHPKIRTINSGICTGKIKGGNLSIIVSTLGTKYEIDTKDSILFLEETREQPYKIDRMLTQLKLAGKLDDASGIVFGQFKGLNSRRPFFPNRSFTIKEILEQAVKPLDKPVVYGMPFGHVDKQVTLPLGINAQLNADTRTLTILDKAVY